MTIEGPSDVFHTYSIDYCRQVANCHSGAPTSPYLSHKRNENAKNGAFSRLSHGMARPLEGILRVARPAKTRPNGHMPVQNDGRAGL